MLRFALLVAFITLCAPPTQAASLAVVAAENVYGDIAQQIGGPDVSVVSILGSPDQDPHLFETSPSAARFVAQAQVVIVNGLDYDPWMQALLAGSRPAGRRTIEVAALSSTKPGDNPHLWYRIETIRILAKTLVAAFTTADAAHGAGYAARGAQFEASLGAIDAEIADLHRSNAAATVSATEPVFGYMFDALGWSVHNMRFQIAVMNDTEPSASDMAAFIDDLKARRIALLVYNRQASNANAQQMVKIAETAHVPVVGVSETKPDGVTYQAWMLSQLKMLAEALARDPS